MATLHVRNVPDDLYERLRREARASRSSIGAETVSLLRRALPGRRQLSLGELRTRARETRRLHRAAPGSPSAVELIREDRERR